MSHLTCTMDNRVATITLNNAPQNRIGDQMVEALAAAIADIVNSDARAVLLRAAGPDFSFGGDILPWPDRSRSALRGTFERYMDVFNRFEQMPLPVVAAVQGLCFGGGLELALRADVLFASETARFGHPEQTLGIVTLLGGIYRVAERAGRARASEWALTSEQVPASVMERAGIVNHVVADDALLAQAQAFVDKLAKGPTRAFAAHKALLRAWAKAASQQLTRSCSRSPCPFLTRGTRPAASHRPWTQSRQESRDRPFLSRVHRYVGGDVDGCLATQCRANWELHPPFLGKKRRVDSRSAEWKHTS